MTTKITFTLPAANVIGAEGCVLLGEFNDWNMDKGIYLARQEDGSMSAEVELSAGNDYQYRYLLSNGRWVNDDGEKITSEMHGYPVVNCIVRVPAMAEAKKPKVTKAAHSALRARPTASNASKAASDGVKDDLTRIEGIGKKIEALLNENNIYSFKQLAATTVTSLKEILDAAGNRYRMHNPGTWPRQAILAADGQWPELELLQQQLKGGK